MKIPPLALTVLLLATSACRNPSHSKDGRDVDSPHVQTAHLHHEGDAQGHGHAGEHESLPATAAMAGDSLFHLDAEWTNQHGQAFRLADLGGRPSILIMLYTTCTTACPLLINDAKRLELALSDSLREKMQIVLVSIDPAVDTPARLAEFAENMRIARNPSSHRWTLLNGRTEDVRELAAVLGVQYRKNADGSFTHSNLLSVLDAEGRIVHRIEGLSKRMEPEAAVLAKIFPSPFPGR